MIKNNDNPEGSKKGADEYYDMTEEASKRPQHNSSTEQARQLESDDINEESIQGPISTPNGDKWDNNKVSTSLSDE